MLNPKFRRQFFDHVADDPASWFLMAWKLKRAADEIPLYDADGDTRKSEDLKEREKLSLWPVHRMLMGLAFENLMKGLLIAQGRAASSDGKLKNEFATHRIKTLLSNLDTSQLPVSPEERDVLLGLEAYVVWLGRYPLPQTAEDHDLPAYGNWEAKLEQQLWERLSDRLADVGWKKDAEGNRVPMRLFGTANQQAP